MGEKLVDFNRRCHEILALIACVALGGMVFAGVFLLVNRYYPVRWPAPALTAAAPELLLTLAPYAAIGLALRYYVRAGVNFACNHFPHDAGARDCAVLAFDLLALSGGAALLCFGLGRMLAAPTAVSWAWWRALPVPLAGLMLIFDALLLLTGLMQYGDAYSSRRVPAYQQKLRRSERFRKLKEEEKALRTQDSAQGPVEPEPKPEARDSLWRGMGQALPSHSARLYLLNKQE